jgi:tol-pal system protein YbgF
MKVRITAPKLAGLWIAVAVAALGSAMLAPMPARGADNADLEQLRLRVVELRRELVMRDLEIDRLAQEMADLRSRVESCESGARQTTPMAPAVIHDDIEVSGPGRIEEFELEEPVRDEAPVPPVPSVIQTGAEPTTGSIPSATGGEELYDQGYALFHQQKYAEAERAFRLFLSRFAGSDLADNALFWIGESRWARGDFAAALESFTATVEQYPDGNKVPDALLKAGRCLESLGQVPRAVRAYEEVVLRFAGSAAALTAEERLAELR